MPKYIIIGLGVSIITFIIMHHWSKLSDKAKNKAIASIFGLIGIGFVALLVILINLGVFPPNLSSFRLEFEQFLLLILTQLQHIVMYSLMSLVPRNRI